MTKLSDETRNFLEKIKGKKLVFTNGCFDIIHSGHVAYLNEARSQGDYLIIGLNSDASVKRLKGPSRPVNSELDRKFILENLKSVDCVQVFEEDTPLEIIKQICPNILVKGGDWKVEQIVGHEFVLSNGGVVKSLMFKDGYSTSKIISDVQGRKWS